MSRWVVKENWNGKRLPQKKEIPVKQSDTDSFKDIKGRRSRHHEPPEFLLKESGLQWQADRCIMRLPIEVHVLFHVVSHRMFGRTEDDKAIKGQMQLMDEKEMEIFERLSEDTAFVRRVEDEIIKRRKRLGIA